MQQIPHVVISFSKEHLHKYTHTHTHKSYHTCTSTYTYRPNTHSVITGNCSGSHHRCAPCRRRHHHHPLATSAQIQPDAHIQVLSWLKINHRTPIPSESRRREPLNRDGKFNLAIIFIEYFHTAR